GQRASGAPRARPAASRSDHDRHCPSALDGARRRSDRGARRGSRGRDRHPSRIADEGRVVCQAGVAPACRRLCARGILTELERQEASMFSHVTVGSNDITRSKAFYDGVATPLGLVRHLEFPDGIGYGRQDGRPQLWIVRPLDKNAATVGNGLTIGLEADTRPAVDAAYAAAIANGG